MRTKEGANEQMKFKDMPKVVLDEINEPNYQISKSDDHHEI